MDDFNAKVGSDNSDHEHVMERHGLGEISESRELFSEFCGYIGNTFIAIGENYLAELRTQRKQWITEDTWRKIEERRNAAIERAKARGTKDVARQRYSALGRKVERSGRRYKRA